METIPALQKMLHSPDQIALLDTAGECTWLQLFCGALGIAAGFVERGVLPGQHAAVMSGNNREYFQVLIGGLLAGVWITPLNRHLTAGEIDYILSDSDSTLLLTMGGVKPPGNSSIPQWELPAGGSPTDSIAAQAVYARVEMLAGNAPGGVLMYTSGTTGRPKGVKRGSPPTVGATLQSWCELGQGIGLDGAGCHLVTGPLYHAAPGLYALYDLLNGAMVVIMEHWDSITCLALIERHRVTHTHLVPTMFVRLLRERDGLARDYDQSSLSLVLHGAAPVAQAVKQSMLDWWGPVLVEYWGGSESGIITRVDSAAWLDHPGTVGRPLPQYELTVRDESFTELPAGEIGLLYARRKGMPRPFSYFRDEGKTAESYVDDWFTLGDLGWLDTQGYAYIADRRSNLIISGGVNIYPAEVESCLLGHPGVADVVVLGLDDPEWGQRIHAIIQLVDPAGDTVQLLPDIQSFARARLAPFKLPRSWEFIEQLPRFDSGKLYRGRLAGPP